MSAMAFIRGQPRLIISLGFVSALTAAYLVKRKLNQACSRVPVTALPISSACRNLIESAGETTTQAAWGLARPPLLHSWSDSSDDAMTHWTPSFVAMQADVPLSDLARYPGQFRGEDHDGDEGDAYSLAQNLFAAFLDARAAGPEAWLFYAEMPQLSFAPGTRLFAKSGLGAFMLGTWSSARAKHVGQPLSLPEDTPQQPASAFPSNKEVVLRSGPTDAAGTVMYWRLPAEYPRAADKAASYGLPWRLMEGGFQEFMVEKVSDETARVTYVCIEASRLHPGAQLTRDFKKLPWLAYELHVVYGQILLYRTLRRLRRFGQAVEQATHLRTHLHD